jgi:hypothetical protein
MGYLGATRDEVLFVAFLILLVLIAPKIPRIGERIGALFERRPEGKTDSTPPVEGREDG